MTLVGAEHPGVVHNGGPVTGWKVR